MARVSSIQVGRVRRHTIAETRDRRPPTWETAFWKEPVNGPVRVGRLGIEGDEQADRRFHGGPDKAVLAYAAEHYAAWQAEGNGGDLPGESRVDFIPGGFGENLTIDGLTEETVYIGDTWQVGDVRLQVSQPRQPCWKLGRRWSMPGLPKRVIATGRTGWYCRVLSEGRSRRGWTWCWSSVHAGNGQ